MSICERRRIEQINTALSKIPYNRSSFRRWLTPYTTASSTVAIMYCTEHGEWTKQYSKISTGHGCSACTMENTHMWRVDSSIYVILVKHKTDCSKDFTGYGTSVSVIRRLHKHRRNLERAGYYIADTYSILALGKGAEFIENAIKSEFALFSQDIEGFVREATHSDEFERLVKFVDDCVEQRNYFDKLLASFREQEPSNVAETY